MENNNKNKGPNKNRQGWGIILFTTLVVTFVVMGLYSMMQGGSASEISYDKFLKLVDNGKVESVTFTNSRINIVLTDDARKEKAEGKLTEVKDNEKASADQSDSSDSRKAKIRKMLWTVCLARSVRCRVAPRARNRIITQEMYQMTHL